MTRRTARSPLTLAVLLLLAASPALADGPWAVRAAGVWLSPVGDSFSATRDRALADGGPDRTTHTVDDDGTGFGVAVDLRLARRWSLEAGAMFVDLDNDFRLEEAGAALTDTETTGGEMFYVGVDWHPAPGARLDPTLGVFVAETSFEDVTFLTEAGRREKLAFDDDYGFGVKLGASLPLGRGGAWFLTAEARYLRTIMEAEVAGQDLDLDPLIVAVGAGYRF